MSSKRARTCGGKRRYRDHAEAVGALKRLKRSTRQTVPHRSFWCGRCNGFHLTSRPEDAESWATGNMPV